MITSRIDGDTDLDRIAREKDEPLKMCRWGVFIVNLLREDKRESLVCYS